MESTGRKPVTVVTETHSFRLVIEGETVAVVLHATSREIGRYRAYAHTTSTGSGPGPMAATA